MNYVPKEWYSSTFSHRVSSHRVGWFKRLHLCTCGASAWSNHGLWQAHIVIEQQLAQSMKLIEENRAKRWRTKIDAEKAKMKPVPTTPRRLPTNDDSDTLPYWDIK